MTWEQVEDDATQTVADENAPTPTTGE